LTGPIERKTQVINQVVGVLDADRNPEQVVAQSRGATRVGVHRRMRHRGRMGHQRLHATQ
jgi:hypothetical protein